ncbi:MAG: RluA family pseudouridine synthase [Candidatus Gracilibacteria bacterium]|jgi:23S rRNA pseudouridine955/2504/2580 synthase|nr:RluA family pseudouridine synthase [Candidatus Gracilibacteria bacterium]
MNKLKITKNEDGQRIDKYLRKRFSEIPLSCIYKFIRQKKIKINNKHAKRDTILYENDELRWFFNPDEFEKLPENKKVPDFKSIYKSDFYNKNLNIVYEDDELIVANKPANLPVHAGTGEKMGRNLIDLVTSYVRFENKSEFEPKLCHRLDKNTSGLVFISKNDSMLRKITALIRGDGIKKTYITLVKGHLDKKRGEIALSVDGKKSLTKYKVIKGYAECSLIEVELKTGRTHQIRIHFSEIGHPLCMDDKYGDFAWNKEFRKKTGLNRQFLHAKSLELIHPVNNKEFFLRVDLPEDLQKCLEKI